MSVVENLQACPSPLTSKILTDFTTDDIDAEEWINFITEYPSFALNVQSQYLYYVPERREIASRRGSTRVRYFAPDDTYISSLLEWYAVTIVMREEVA